MLGYRHDLGPPKVPVGMSGVRCCRGAEPLIKSGWRSPKAHHLPSVTLWLFNSLPGLPWKITIVHGKIHDFNVNFP